MVNRCYLKPAVIAAGVITSGKRFGFHLLRHGLSMWVNNATKGVKVVQSLLRHSNPDITVGIYIHSVPEENLKAQGQHMTAMMKGEHPSQACIEGPIKAKSASSSLQ